MRISRKGGNDIPGGGPGVRKNDRRANELRRFYIQNEYGEKIEMQGGSVFVRPGGAGIFRRCGIYGGRRLLHRDTPGIRADGKDGDTGDSCPPGRIRDTGNLPTGFAAERLTLAYSADGDWYFCDVDITDMEKPSWG